MADEFASFLTGIKAAGAARGYGSTMNRCIESMMEEHALIVEVLAALQSMAYRLEVGEAVERRDVADFGRFFRDFADKCHHGKEEDRLFVKMVEAGFPLQAGPIAVMLAEHDAGRQEVRGMLQIGAGSGPLTEEERHAVAGYASQFVPLLYSHIQKENNILYPMAQQAISAPELGRLDKSCEEFDREIAHKLDVTALKDLASALIRRYPANTEALAVHGGCCG